METRTLYDPPTGTNLISLVDAKKFLRIDHATSDEDDVITAYINAAVSYCENFCSKLFDKRPVYYYLQSGETFIFPLGELNSITNIQSRLTATESYVFLTPVTNYFVKGGTPGKVFFKDIPSTSNEDMQSITIVASHGRDAVDVSDAVLQAVRMLVGHYYEQRTATVVGSIVSSVPMGVTALLNPERYIRIES